MPFKRTPQPKNNNNKELSEDQKSKYDEQFANAAGIKVENSKKTNKEKLTKISLNMREGDLNRTGLIIDKLIDNRQRKPLPTATDIHRMGILCLSQASDEEIVKLFKQLGVLCIN